jgi:hypothetical protein
MVGATYPPIVPAVLPRPDAEVSPDSVVSVDAGESTEVDKAIYLGGNGLDIPPRVDPDSNDAESAAPTLTREL